MEDPDFDIVAKIESGLAAIFRNLPFMNTDKEQTHTVADHDPPRNISGSLKKHLI